MALQFSTGPSKLFEKLFGNMCFLTISRICETLSIRGGSGDSWLKIHPHRSLSSSSLSSSDNSVADVTAFHIAFVCSHQHGKEINAYKRVVCHEYSSSLFLHALNMIEYDH